MKAWALAVLVALLACVALAADQAPANGKAPKYDKATEAYQRALMLDPEVFERRSNYGTLLEDRNVEERAKFHYYLAKMYAKSGRNDMAMQYVRKALEEGFKDKKKFEEDPEFEALRNLPEFKDLLTVEPRVL